MKARLNVVITKRAGADIEQIRAYLLDVSPRGAENVRRAILTTLEHLALFPKLGRERVQLGVRAVGVPRYSYTIYYRLLDDAVEILHVRDDRRKPLAPGDL